MNPLWKIMSLAGYLLSPVWYLMSLLWSWVPGKPRILRATDSKGGSFSRSAEENANKLGMVTMVGKPSPGWYFVQLVTGEVIQVHHSDLHAPAAQKQSLSSSVHIGKKPAPKNASKVAFETAKDVKRHSPVNSEASTSTPSCPPLPKTVLGNGRQLCLRIPPAMLKLFLPHLVSREGERNQEKRSVVKRIEIPTKHITLPWMEQDKLKGKMGSSGTPTFCFTGRLLSTNNISFWCTLYATIAATIVTTLSVAKSVACGSSSSCSNISISSSSDASFTAENVETSAYGCNIAALTKLAGSRTASVHAITAVRGWLLANMDSLVMCGHPVERLLQPLHMKALECSWLDIFAIGVAAGAGLALGGIAACGKALLRKALQ